MNHEPTSQVPEALPPEVIEAIVREPERASPSSRHPVLSWLPFLLVTFGAAMVGSLLTTPEIKTWYVTLEKPTMNPPNWVFPVVWNVLYFLWTMAARWAWFLAPSQSIRKQAMGLFILQMALNVAWSALFFGMHRIDLALAAMLLMYVMMIPTLQVFWRIRPRAALALVPYLIWISFAFWLNCSIYWLNPTC